MGRWNFSTKQETDHLKKIEIGTLKKWGYLQKDSWRGGTMTWTNGLSGVESSVGIAVSTFEGDDYLQLTYTQTSLGGEKRNFDYKIQLAVTPCNYGGVRHWFICPLVKNGAYCGKRVGVLYKGGDYFGCRECQNLTYHSQKENRQWKNYCYFGLLN